MNVPPYNIHEASGAWVFLPSPEQELADLKREVNQLRNTVADLSRIVEKMLTAQYPQE